MFQRQISKQGLNTVLDFDGCGNDNVGCGPIAGVCGERNEGKWEAKFTREELKDLFSLREDTLCDTHDLVQCGCGGGRGLVDSARSSAGISVKVEFTCYECLLWKSPTIGEPLRKGMKFPSFQSLHIRGGFYGEFIP